MAVNLSPVGGVAAQFFDNDGNVLSGGKIYTYVAGTSTPTPTYTTAAGNIAHTNPIILDSAGRVPTGEIWLTDGILYKFVLRDSGDALIATYDNISGINSNSVAYTNQQEIITATAGQTVFDLTITYAPGTNSLSVFVDGVNQYGPGAQYAYTETDGNTITFNSGLHVGAEVKFTSTQQQGAGAVDSSQVTYDPPFTGSVVTNVEAKLAQTVSVKDFGAVGDGVVDDTSAIQDALDYANTATSLVDGGLGVYIPSGVYKTTDTLDIYSNTCLFGDGRSSIIHFVNNARDGAIKGTGTQLTPLNGISLKSFTLYGDTSYSVGVPSVINGEGIGFQFVDRSIVYDVLVSGFSDGGISFLNGNYNTISNCLVRYTAQAISFNANAISVYGNIMDANIVEVTGTYNGLHLEGSFGAGLGDGEVIGTVISGNNVRSCYERGINIEVAPYTTCTGNTVSYSGAGNTAVNEGIFLFGAYGSTVVGNTVTFSDGYGINVSANSGNTTISGNTTVSNTGGSMSVNDGAGVATTYNVTAGDNNLTEGDLVTSGNVSFINRTQGFTFSNVASAGATTLDWYQENTFTATAVGSTSAGTATYSVQLGQFTRIGNTVFFSIQIGWSSHTGTGNLRISGLPYAASGTVTRACSVVNNGIAAAGEVISAQIPQGGVSYINIMKTNQTTGALTNVAIQAAVTELTISGQYQV